MSNQLGRFAGRANAEEPGDYQPQRDHAIVSRRRVRGCSVLPGGWLLIAGSLLTRLTQSAFLPSAERYCILLVCGFSAQSAEKSHT
jgi:hypothetical protein